MGKSSTSKSHKEKRQKVESEDAETETAVEIEEVEEATKVSEDERTEKRAKKDKKDTKNAKDKKEKKDKKERRSKEDKKRTSQDMEESTTPNSTATTTTKTTKKTKSDETPQPSTTTTTPTTPSTDATANGNGVPHNEPAAQPTISTKGSLPVSKSSQQPDINFAIFFPKVVRDAYRSASIIPYTILDGVAYVLLGLEMRKKHNGWFWSPCGGKREEGEDVEDTCLREFSEETGGFYDHLLPKIREELQKETTYKFYVASGKECVQFVPIDFDATVPEKFKLWIQSLVATVDNPTASEEQKTEARSKLDKTGKRQLMWVEATKLRHGPSILKSELGPDFNLRIYPYFGSFLRGPTVTMLLYILNTKPTLCEIMTSIETANMMEQVSFFNRTKESGDKKEGKKKDSNAQKSSDVAVMQTARSMESVTLSDKQKKTKQTKPVVEVTEEEIRKAMKEKKKNKEKEKKKRINNKP